MYRKSNWLNLLVAAVLLGTSVLSGVVLAPSADAQETESAKVAALITAEFADWNPVITAEALYENLTDGDESNDPFILSVRKAEDYAKGHIPGAYNIFWKDIVKAENLAKLPTDRPIVTYCYTGHTGEAAAVFLRLLGYDASTLKFGMMGWTDDLDVLAIAPFEGAAGYPVETEVHELTEEYDPPVLETGLADAVEIVKARGLEVFANWVPTIEADAVFENLTDGDESNDPLIISVRKAEDYAKGHVPGAVNVFWKDIAKDLSGYPTDKQIVTYCYTGHTGEAAAVALALLGYDVVTMKYGMMGWTDDLEVLAQEPFTEPAGYPVQTELNELPGGKAAAPQEAKAETEKPAASIDESEAVAALITAEFADWNPVITAEALYENLTDGDESNDPFILSVRKAEDYAKGHIPGAYNIFWKDIVKAENLAKLPTDQPIVTYCYTGHTGEAAAVFLRLLGYDASTLKFGMMGWTDDLDVLAIEPFEGAAGYPVETEVHELTEEYDPPVLETGLADAVEIVKARGLEVFADWVPTIEADAVFENLTDGDESNDPLIISVRKAEDYAKGHVLGAANVFWKDIAKDLSGYPTDKQIVTYCYTGHTGEAAAVALALLGYDVVTMKYGMMGWTDDLEVLAQEPFTEPAGYPVQTEPNEL